MERMQSTPISSGIPNVSRTKSSAGSSIAPNRPRTCIQQLPKPRSAACNCMRMAAIEASSIHVSVRVMSAVTTIASAAPAMGLAPEVLHSDKRASVSLSSTAMNSHGVQRLDEGASNPASRMVLRLRAIAPLGCICGYSADELTSRAGFS